MMHSSLHLEQFSRWHQQTLLAEAASARLADLAAPTNPRRNSLRARIAVALHALAGWLDDQAVAVLHAPANPSLGTSQARG